MSVCEHDRMPGLCASGVMCERRVGGLVDLPAAGGYPGQGVPPRGRVLPGTEVCGSITVSFALAISRNFWIKT